MVSLCRWHETIRSTPAEALGLTDHAWSIGELLDAALAVATPDPTETAPDRAGVLEAIKKKQFCWRLEEIDWEGPWGWSQAVAEDVLRIIVPKLHNYETMTWAEMDGPSGSHSVDLDQLCSEAQGRLDTIGRGHLDRTGAIRCAFFRKGKRNDQGPTKLPEEWRRLYIPRLAVRRKCEPKID